jgi:phage/plasmid-like protein (TIGR03299 family)
MVDHSMQTEADMGENTVPDSPDSDAEFLGWQETLSGAIVPLYSVTVANHPLYHSTVSEATLRRLHLRVPLMLSPYPETALSPWHNLGVKLNHPKTAREAIEKAGLDYTVVREKLAANTGLEQEAYATIRTDTRDVLGIVPESYEPIQNRDAFTFFNILVNNDEAIYETAGKLGHGERIWILAKLRGCITVNSNDIVNKYLLLTNSHDGCLHVQVKHTPIRAVCNNTLTFTMHDEGDIQIRHTPNAMGDLEQAAQLLGLANFLYGRLDVVFNKMAARKITDEQMQEYVETLVPDNEEAEGNSITENIRNNVLQMYESGRGAHLTRGTLWGAFNSVTEYTDHMMLCGDSTARLNAIWFGRGEQLKQKAFHLAEQMI